MNNMQFNNLNDTENINNFVLNALDDFLKTHPKLNKNDVINKAILDYIKNYDKLVIYSKTDSK